MKSHAKQRVTAGSVGLFSAVALVTALACGRDRSQGGEQSGAGQAASPGGQTTPAAAAPAGTDAPAPSGPIDEALAARGEQAFQTRACVGCHKIGGGRLTGPDLKGVTDRRSYEWIVAMITNPDSMLRVDPTARQLLAEIGTPMANMAVPKDEARALYEYLRRESQ